MSKHLRRLSVATTLLALAGAAAAHPGHDTQSLAAGLAHPFGADHLLAMVAVGLWSAAALQGARRWAGPAVFLLAMALGATVGVAFVSFGMALPFVEMALAGSVLVLGLMLVFKQQLPAMAGLGLVAAAALLHGLAHGAEAPAAGSMAAYATGFIATTALLHAGGLLLGQWLQGARLAVWRVAGSSLAGAGVMLMAQV